jgi:hypothetical protein
MYFPLLHERVRVRRREGLFRVVRIDYKHGLTDLVNLESHDSLSDIPFALLLSKFKRSK